jgi:hypothetical protein
MKNETRGCIYHGEHLYQRLVSAGFVDIQVIEKFVDLGNWRPVAGNS